MTWDNFLGILEVELEKEEPDRNSPEQSDIKGSDEKTGPTESGSAFRPGRLLPIEIVQRVFPYHKRNVLELVLHGCNGDVAKTIEHFLSASDTMVAQTSRQQKQPIKRYHPYAWFPSPFGQSYNPLLKYSQPTGYRDTPFLSLLNGRFQHPAFPFFLPRAQPKSPPTCFSDIRSLVSDDSDRPEHRLYAPPSTVFPPSYHNFQSYYKTQSPETKPNSPV